MKNKKLLAVVGLVAVTANMGFSSLAFAQVPNPTTGTQEIACPTLVSEAYSFKASNGVTVDEPADFSFAPRQAYNTYEIDTPGSAGAAARENTAPAVADAFNIHSNVSSSCTTSPSVSLAVAAGAAFKTDADVYLSNTGAIGGNNALLAFAAAPVATCATNGVCEVLSGGTYIPTTYTGSTAHGYVSGGGSQAGTPGNYLINSDANVPTKNLFTTDQPFTGDVTVDGIRYYISVPADVAAGEFKTTLTYTLS